jgi:hypothetical protein
MGRGKPGFPEDISGALAAGQPLRFLHGFPCREKENSLTGPIENSPRIFNSHPPVRLPLAFPLVRDLRTPASISNAYATAKSRKFSSGKAS